MHLPFELGAWIVVVPIVFALVVLTFAGSGGRTSQGTAVQKPEEPQKRRRPGWLARWRARRGVRHGWSRWTIGYASPIVAAGVELAELRHHTLICGATGSGKTTALQSLVAPLPEQLPIVIVDCKASAGLRAPFSPPPKAAGVTHAREHPRIPP